MLRSEFDLRSFDFKLENISLKGEVMLQESNLDFKDKKIELQGKDIEKELENKETQIEDLKVQLLLAETKLKRKQNEIRNLNHTLDVIYKSRSWKIIKIFKSAKKNLLKVSSLLLPEKKSSSKKSSREQNGIMTKHTFVPVPYDVLNFESFEPVEIPQFDSPLVSIVIPVYNQFKFTYACVRSILNTVKDIPYEIIIGDDLSTDETRNIKDIFKGIKVNKNEACHGFLMNCNSAARLARGKYICFLNNDTQVQENWLSSLLNLLEKNEKIGIAGSKLVYPDGTLQEAGGIIWSDGTGMNYGRGDDPSLPEYNYVKEVDYISGASIIIRADLWNEIGGFDERFKPAYYEDTDLAFETRKRGYKVMYQPESVVIHFEGVSNGKDLSSGLKKYQDLNSAKFCQKWSEELKRQYKPSECVFKARERNFSKKTVLILDHHVPTFDKDAGGKATMQYMQMFLQKGYVVKFIDDTFGEMEGSERYQRILSQMGVENLTGEYYKENIFAWIKANESNIDFFIMMRPHIAEKYIDFVKENTKIKVIYYGHDLSFLRLEREAEVTKDKKAMEEAKEFKEREFALMRKADVVYLFSSFEVDYIKKTDSSINAKIINLYMFDSDKISCNYNPNGRKDLVFVGAMNRVPNIDAAEWFVKEVFPKVRGKIPEVRFYMGKSC